MPSKPKRVCNSCGKAVRGGCGDCRKKSRAAREVGRPSAHARGYGARWRKLRKLVLHADPICAVCNRQASKEVDHIIPKHQAGRDSLDNLQGICERCHAEKTARENMERTIGAQSAHNLNRDGSTRRRF